MGVGVRSKVGPSDYQNDARCGASGLPCCLRNRSSVGLPAMSRTSTESLPPAARAIALLLASTPTVQDAQPGVLHQLLEFSHRYTAQALSDALVYAEHATRPNKVEMDDVTLAVQARVGWEFGGRVPKEVGPSFSILLPFAPATIDISNFNAFYSHS